MFSQLLRKAKQRGFILPFIKSGGQPAGQDGVAYEGATVLEPKIGAFGALLLLAAAGNTWPQFGLAVKLYILDWCKAVIKTERQCVAFALNGCTCCLLPCRLLQAASRHP